MNINMFLSKKIQQALVTLGASADCKAQVRHSAKTQFGDYQVNGIMAIAMQLRLPPRELAKKVVDLLELGGIASKIEIAGHGFINIYLDPSWLEKHLTEAIDSPRLGVANVPPQTIVVDYSAPNIAKEMHVGHVRSTIVGDASVRTLIFLGHNVIKANHIGDWGTQFGMLIAYLEKLQQDGEAEMQISCLERFYRAAKQHYDKDPVFTERARDYVVKLQRGDKYCRKMWHKLVNVTMEQNQKIYDRLNVTLKHNDIMGESLYNPMLPGIVSDLKEKGIAAESEGAIVVFLEEFKNKQGEPMGVIIQKKDGAYLYTTIDIACAKYRYETLKAERMIYYIDSRQHQHLMQVWTIVRKAGYVPESVPLEHHMLGMMLSKDGKPFKTRSGGVIKLTALLDEALERARYLIATKNPYMEAAELERLAQVVSVGAIKYAELSKNRTTDYVFNWDNMLSFEGNTALYIQYAYTRIASIFKQRGQNKQQFTSDIRLKTIQETQLAVRLLQFEEAVITVARDGTPHILCTYMYDLAVLFSTFYEHCPILNAKHASLCQSRLQLALLTGRTLKQGLNLLGIETVERM
ncbi:arginine--tRNA ligase [Sodalis endosymbiont of Henestaris halophilus]|uniref:arginine--tRNA ligase n=1 Tax=Sodalis endosymbiont of Henestaris halophilus TaxID=1929246 RepID=UPI000BC01244|nr:arginine--tRNA ligase [Sodalis endosymbiont of Henestaris halophilus]SNC58450.1 Arginine--tRNA ligase [Sodalis endosymbiont of Henestaris halophilus]